MKTTYLKVTWENVLNQTDQEHAWADEWTRSSQVYTGGARSICLTWVPQPEGTNKGFFWPEWNPGHRIQFGVSTTTLNLLGLVAVEMQTFCWLDGSVCVCGGEAGIGTNQTQGMILFHSSLKQGNVWTNSPNILWSHYLVQGSQICNTGSVTVSLGSTPNRTTDSLWACFLTLQTKSEVKKNCLVRKSSMQPKMQKTSLPMAKRRKGRREWERKNCPLAGSFVAIRDKPIPLSLTSSNLCCLLADPLPFLLQHCLLHPYCLCTNRRPPFFTG